MIDFERVKEELQAPVAAPLYQRLSKSIKNQITNGTLQPGDSLPPERILKEQLGISRSTIRQAIQNLINDGLLKSIVGAGTFVLEPQEKPSLNPLVGIIVPDSNYSVYYPELASSLNFGLRKAGYRVDTNIHNDRFETLAQVTSSLLSQHAKAIVIVAPNQKGGDEIVRQLQEKGIITLLLTRYLTKFSTLDYIGVDNQLIGREATQHLINLGHTNILHISGSVTSTASDRASGYISAMKDAGLTPQIYIAPDEQGLLPFDLMPYVLKIDLSELWIWVVQKKFTGVFAFNDKIASWVQKEIRKFNLSIPRDLSLISVDNMPYADFFDTPLTTFALPGDEIGKQAADLLLRKLNGEVFPPQRILLPGRLVQRLSTTTPPHNITALNA